MDIEQNLEINLNKYTSEFDSIRSWITEQYESRFKSYFEDIESLSFKDDEKITDEELEKILIKIPLKLFDASEEFVNMNIKKQKMMLKSKVFDSDEVVDESSIFLDELIVKSFNAIIERVTRQLTYAKELVLSAKKIWSARKATEELGEGLDNSSILDSLPEYKFEKEYIK